MSPILLAVSIILVVSQIALPKRWAFLPLVISTCHVPNVPIFEAGGAFTITKLLLLAGLVRAAYEGRRCWSLRQPLDIWILLWACWALASAIFHHPRDHNPFTIRLSLVYDTLGAYLYARSFLQTTEDMARFSKALAITILPVAALMIAETMTGHNLYASLGAPLSEIRAGSVRANGPFAHSILAGTTGAACCAIFAPLLRRHRALGVAGLIAGVSMAVTSHSSGPYLSLMCVVGTISLWPWRRKLRLLQASALVGLVVLQLAMKAPIWYLIARVDFTGSSTSYYRAELITQALNHLDEWWAVGTDYTRHWMATGSIWSGEQSDLTNFYVRIGVIGGLPLLILFLAIFWKAYQLIGIRMDKMRRHREKDEFTVWCVGAMLVVYNASLITVTLFDQSYIFFCLALGSVPGITRARARVAAQQPASNRHQHSIDLPAVSHAV